MAARRSCLPACRHRPPASSPTSNRQAAAPDAWSGDLLVLGVFEGAFDTPGGEADKDAKPAIKSAALTALDGGLGGALADIVSTYEFKGKAVRASPAAQACCVWLTSAPPPPLPRAPASGQLDPPASLPAPCAACRAAARRCAAVAARLPSM